MITPFRKSRHASPPVSAGCPGSFSVGWISTSTSWPLMEVYAGSPERISRHTGALLPGLGQLAFGLLLGGVVLALRGARERQGERSG